MSAATTRPFAGVTPSTGRRVFDPFPFYSCAGFDEFGAPIDIEWHAKYDNAIRRAQRLAVAAYRRRSVTA